ncbi:acyltransferase family protein [Streptomyces sp. NPDC056244]|uniref:acyltransferase family protein n=1 Tax=Streptomyces sp. NPDC056244 TaxID=3345762 RepID=UPI0035E05748
MTQITDQPVRSVSGAPTAGTAKTPAEGAAEPSAGAAPAGAAKTARSRDAFFDNAKYLAIVLVAVAHAWEPLRSGSRAVSALYIVVYAFHMPAFIIISGYFSRSFDFRPDRVRRLITGIAVPYIVFEVAYSLFHRWTDNDPDMPVSLLDPWYLTWFLLALFVWRMTAPLWRVVRWPVPIALLIAALATTSPQIGDDLDLQRLLQFLPFFVLGLRLKPEHFQLVRRRAVRIAAVPVFAGTVVFAYWAITRMNMAWFFHRDSAQELGVPWWTGVLMTFALFGCGLVLSACFFSLVPGRRLWFTALGAGTLCGYLLHGFLAQSAGTWGWYDPGWLYGPVGEVFVSLVAAVAVTLLCTKPVQRIFRFALEPEMAWAFRKEPAKG